MKITLFDRTVGRMGILLCVLSLLSGCGKRGDQLTPQEKSTRISLDFEAGIANDNPQLKMSAIQLDADLDQKYFPKLKLNVGETVDGHLLIREKNGGGTVHKQDIVLEAKSINGVTKLCHKSSFELPGYSKEKEYLACVIVGGANLYQERYYGYGYQPFVVDASNKTLDIGAQDKYLNIPYTTVWSKLSFDAQDEAVIRDDFHPRGFFLRIQVENPSGVEISVLSVKPTETTSFSNMVYLDITQMPKENTLPYFSEYLGSPVTNLTMPENVQSQSSSRFIFLWLGNIGNTKTETIPLTVSYQDLYYYLVRETKYGIKAMKDGQTKYLKLKIR